MKDSKLINFRVSPDVAKALRAVAKWHGASVSQYLRCILDEALVADLPELHRDRDKEVDPFSLLARAARGSLQAQRDLANIGVQAASTGGADMHVGFAEAMIFARLAATHGHLADQGLVIGIASLMAEALGDEACECETAEAMARIAIADEAGAEKAGDALRVLVERASPELVELAKEYRSRIRDQVFKENV